MTDYEIIAYRPEFKQQVAELHGDAFGLGSAGSRRYMEWKYERNPYIHEPLLFLALDRHGSVVGMRGFYGTCWAVGGQRLVLPCADDFAIAPGVRNQGLATMIMRVALDALSRNGFGFVLNASGGLVTVLQSLAMGWRSLGPMEPVARINRMERIRRALNGTMKGKPFVWRFARETRRGDPSCFSRLDRSGRRSAQRGGSVIVGSSPRPEAMSELVAGHHEVGCIRHVRDPGFFRWRFDNPTREYRFLYHEREGNLAGFLIVARYEQHGVQSPPCNVVDLEGRDQRVRAELLEAALDWGRFRAVGAWSASLPADCRKMLAERGFAASDLERRARGMPCFLVKKLGSSGVQTAVIETEAWDVRLIDSMHG